MKVLNLRCAHDHRFEGWFGSGDDFESQSASGLVSCPVCADTVVTRLPTAPRIQSSASRRDDAPTPAAGTELQNAWMQAVRHMMASTEDVGARFPEEARRMHYGETATRGIRGQASREDADALRDEGIEVMALPVPAALKGPVQ
jgi:hypothetical protein